jgi:virulence factor Mce-like protein
MRRGRGAGLTASPTMVGALTVMVVVLAVFLAYNANNGLPFVPAYRVSVLVPNADTLVPGNEVRIGGVRVGAVESIEPEISENGDLSAKLDLKLDEDANPIPVDSTLIVRSRSALGLKYLEIDQGKSDEGFVEGSIIPLSAATPQPVELDTVLNTFDKPTQAAIQQNLMEFGDAVAGRGPTLNAAIGRLPGVLEVLQPVAHNLSSPRTDLAGFINALGATAAEVAPVAEDQARAFIGLDTTFTALAEVARPFIEESITEGVPTEETAIETLPRIRTLLANTTGLFDDLLPAATSLRKNSPTIANSLEIGAPVLAKSAQLNEQLAPTFESLLGLNNDTGARLGISAATLATDELGPLISFIAPAQTVCNYGALLAGNLTGVFTGGNDLGAWQRFIVFDVPKGPNNEGSPSSTFANGGGDGKNFLHSNPYPNTAAPGQTNECEAGNEEFIPNKAVIGNVPGNQGILTRGQDLSADTSTTTKAGG